MQDHKAFKINATNYESSSLQEESELRQNTTSNPEMYLFEAAGK